jgi:hypothetical protein
MASSSKSSSTGAPDPVQAALDAAKQLSSIWTTGSRAKLLQPSPAAAWGGKAAEAVDQSTALLKALHDVLNNIFAWQQQPAASMEQLLLGLEQHQLGSLLARLIVWLQQWPEVSLEQPAGSSSSSSSTASDMWWCCMACLSSLLGFITAACKSKPESTSESVLHYMEHVTTALDETGGQQRGSDSRPVLLCAVGSLCSLNIGCVSNVYVQSVSGIWQVTLCFLQCCCAVSWHRAGILCTSATVSRSSARLRATQLRVHDQGW